MKLQNMNPQQIAKLISEDPNMSFDEYDGASDSPEFEQKIEATRGLLTYWDSPKIRGAIFIIGDEQQEIMRKVFALAKYNKEYEEESLKEVVMLTDEGWIELIGNETVLSNNNEDGPIHNILLTRGVPKDQYKLCDLLSEIGMVMPLIIVASDNILDIGDIAVDYGVWIDDESAGLPIRANMTDDELIKAHQSNQTPDYDIMTLSKYGLKVV